MVRFLTVVFVGQLIIIKELALKKVDRSNKMRQGKGSSKRQDKCSKVRQFKDKTQFQGILPKRQKYQ